MFDELLQALADLEEDRTLAMVRAELARGAGALPILQACQRGMAMVGERFERDEYFVSDLMMAGEIFKQVNAILAPGLEAGERVRSGAVVIGTVQGDIHDIGKDLVVNMLRSANFEVTDLGVDVAPARFVAALQDTGAPVVGMSGLLTVAFDAMQATTAAITAAGLRDTVRIMVGGGPVNAQVCAMVGADDWGPDAQAAVRLCRRWLGDGQVDGVA